MLPKPHMLGSGLKVISEPRFHKIFDPGIMYDQLLVKRYEAKQDNNYELTDAMREAAAWCHGRWIIDTAEEYPKGGLHKEPGHSYQQFYYMYVHDWLKLFKDNLTFMGKPVDDLIFTFMNPPILHQKPSRM